VRRADICRHRAAADHLVHTPDLPDLSAPPGGHRPAFRGFRRADHAGHRQPGHVEGRQSAQDRHQHRRPRGETRPPPEPPERRSPRAGPVPSLRHAAHPHGSLAPRESQRPKRSITAQMHHRAASRTAVRNITTTTSQPPAAWPTSRRFRPLLVESQAALRCSRTPSNGRLVARDNGPLSLALAIAFRTARLTPRRESRCRVVRVIDGEYRHMLATKNGRSGAGWTIMPAGWNLPLYWAASWTPPQWRAVTQSNPDLRHRASPHGRLWADSADRRHVTHYPERFGLIF